MHTFKALVTNTLVGATGTIATIGVGMALKILLVRVLSLQDFGVLVSAQAMVGFLLFAAALCIPDAVVWLAARDVETEGSAGSTLTTGVALGAATGMVASLALFLIAGLASPQAGGLPTTVALLGLMIPLTVVGEIFAASLRSVGVLWPKVIALDLGRPALSLLAAGVLAALDRLTLFSMSVVLVGASVVTGAIPAALAWRAAATRPVWSCEARRVRAILRYGLPLLAAGLLAGPIVNNGIPAILALVVSTSDVALYSASLALQVVVYIPTAAVEQAILPRWSLNGGPSRQEFQTVTRWSLLLASVPFAVLWLAPSAVLATLFGARYAGAGLLVQIAALTTYLGASVGPNEAALRANGDTRWIFIARLIAAVSGLGLASALISAWGALGAVVGLSTASATVNALYAIRLWRRQAIQPLTAEYLKAVVAMLASLTGTYLIASRVAGGVIATLSTVTTVYPCLLALSLVLLGMEEPRLVMSALRTLSRRRHPAASAR